MWSRYLSNNVWRDFRLSVPAFATEARKCCNGKFSAKIVYVTITDAGIKRLKTLHTLFDKYLEHMQMKFEHKRMKRNVQNLKLFGKNG